MNQSVSILIKIIHIISGINWHLTQTVIISIYFFICLVTPIPFLQTKDLNIKNLNNFAKIAINQKLKKSPIIDLVISSCNSISTRGSNIIIIID